MRDTLILPRLFLGSISAAYWAGERSAGEGCGWTNGLIWSWLW